MLHRYSVSFYYIIRFEREACVHTTTSDISWRMASAHSPLDTTPSLPLSSLQSRTLKERTISKCCLQQKRIGGKCHC